MGSLAAITVALCALSGTPEHAHESRDRAALLYSNQLAFTEEGVPVVTVGLMDGQERVSVRARGGLRVGLSGESGAEVFVPPGHQFDARVVDGVPGETRYRVVLEAVPGGDLAALRLARQRWLDRGHELEVAELGGIVGYPGRLLDTRRTLVVESGHYATRNAAKERSDALADKWLLPEPPTVFSEPVTRARGSVIATDRKTGVTIRQESLLVIKSADGGPIEVRRVEFGRGYSHHGFEDRSYHGSIIIAVDPSARLAVVNRVSGEQLLRGLVPAEIYPTSPAAALDAQAIAARGELLAKLGTRHLADPYLICATQHCQVYSGRGKETRATDAAVRRTRGLMLFDAEDRLVDSVYSASCGGHTEHNEHVWEGVPKPSLRGHADAPTHAGIPWDTGQAPDDDQVSRFLDDRPHAWCGASSRGRKVFRWTRDYPRRELDRLVNARHPIGRVTAIDALERGVSGRVKAVRFTGERSSVVVRGELAVRRLLGNLRSGLFVVKRDERGWHFRGAGFGHGVGMCQQGAIGMAEHGHDGAAILRHFYSGGTPQPVY